MSFYQLPNPWNPGFVIPDYVMAEPPERGTFTTQWLPRGTISELVPDFLAKRTGRKLLGRNDADLGSLGDCAGGSIGGSSLSGDSLGAREYELEPLGAPAVEYPPPYPGPYRAAGGAPAGKVAAYGNQIAAQLFAVAKAYPKKQRAAVMKAAMDRIDPALYGRCKATADTLVARGMPAPTALRTAIAHGVVTGLATQLHQVGTKRLARGRRSRSSPQSSSSPGLGRDRGMSALGAVSTTFRSLIGGGGQVQTSSQATPTGVVGNPPPGFTWNMNHWERCPPGCTPIASPYGGATINTHTGAVTAMPNDWAKHKLLSVGPFLFQADVDTSCLRLMGVGSSGSSDCDDIHDKNFIDMAPTIKGMIMKQLTTDCSFNFTALAGGLVTSLVSIPIGAMGFIGSKPCITSSMEDSGYGTKLGALSEFLGGRTPVLDRAGKPTGKYATVFPPKINQDYIQLIGVDDDRKNPIIVTKHPISGKDYGVFMILQPNHDTGKPWGGTANPVDLIFSFEPLPDGWASGIVAWVMHLATEIVDLVGQVVEGIADATCNLLTSPGVTQSLLGAAGKAPSTTTVGIAVGAAVGAAACGGPKAPPPCPPGQMRNPVTNVCQPIAPPFNIMPFVLLGGGVLLLIGLTR